MCLAAVCVFVGCTRVGEEAMQKASSIEDGETVAHPIEVAGQPSRRGEPSPECRAVNGVSALIYEIREVRLGGLLGSDPLTWLVMCEDGSGRILQKVTVAQ
jgi:hypothetical protein